MGDLGLVHVGKAWGIYDYNNNNNNNNDSNINNNVDLYITALRFSKWMAQDGESVSL